MITAIRHALWRAFTVGNPAYRKTCWVYCPGCRRDLTETPDAFVSDDEAGVLYRCPCGRESLWDFDAPTPLLRRSSNVERVELAAEVGTDLGSTSAGRDLPDPPEVVP